MGKNPTTFGKKPHSTRESRTYPLAFRGDREPRRCGHRPGDSPGPRNRHQRAVQVDCFSDVEIVKGELWRAVQLLEEGRASVAEVVDLDDLEGDYDDEEDGDGVTSVDVSVKFEQLEDEESQSLSDMTFTRRRGAVVHWCSGRTVARQVE